eukprot:3892029-Pyramimonas_sp.AAC.1
MGGAGLRSVIAFTEVRGHLQQCTPIYYSDRSVCLLCHVLSSSRAPSSRRPVQSAPAGAAPAAASAAPRPPRLPCRRVAGGGRQGPGRRLQPDAAGGGAP